MVLVWYVQLCSFTKLSPCQTFSLCSILCVCDVQGSKMKLDLRNLSTVNCSVDKMVSFIEKYNCSQVPFMWQLLEAVLTKPGQL